MDIAKLEFFNKITYNCFPQFDTNLISIPTDNIERFLKFKQFSENILFTENYDFNILEIHNIIYHLVNENPITVNQIIIKTISKFANDISEKINTEIQNNTFTISS